MKPTAQLAELGQSIWLDNITRTLLDDGTIAEHIAEHSVTGLTSNPSIFDKAIASGAYDEAIRSSSGDAESVFFNLALEDLQRAADLFAPIFAATDGVDGFVSLEVSPEIANDTAATVAAATQLFARGNRPNLFIKIPGTPEGLPAIEEAVAAGVPVNVTLLFDTTQYEAAAEAYLRGIERRIEAGLDPKVASVASVFMSRWDVSVNDSVPDSLRDQLALAVGRKIYATHHQLLASERWQKVLTAGARPQRVLWASTSAKDPRTPDDLYVRCLAAPGTVNTMPDGTLEAFFDHGRVDGVLPLDGGDCDVVLGSFEAAGVDVSALATKLQDDGAAAFVAAWRQLIAHVDEQLGGMH